MKTIQEIAQDICSYYDATRRIGHTTLTIEGLATYMENAILIIGSIEEEKRIRAFYKLGNNIKIIDIHSLYNLRGVNIPIIFDNSAIHYLMSMIAYKR